VLGHEVQRLPEEQREERCRCYDEAANSAETVGEVAIFVGKSEAKSEQRDTEPEPTGQKLPVSHFAS
jgi:hypothetical protein